MQSARGDQVVRCAGVVEQRGDLERVGDEGAAIRSAPLSLVGSLSPGSTAARVWGSPSVKPGMRRWPTNIASLADCAKCEES